MTSLSRFEANLMSILYGLLGERPVNSIMPALDADLARPSCLTREAVDMVQAALSKGLVKWLSEMEGWKTQRFVRGEEVVQGRLWERWPPQDLGLKFSEHTLDFLMAITATSAKADTTRWVPQGVSPLELGDNVFLFKAMDVIRASRVARRWTRLKTFRRHPLLALSLPHQTEGKLDYSSWMSGSRVSLLETLQQKLAQDWIELEQSKAELARIEDLAQLARRQTGVLSAYMDACEQAGRLDLCRFVLIALRTTTEVSDVRSWVAMDLSGLRIADRKEVYEQAASFLSVAERLKKWHQKCQATGYFDEGYAAAQLWLADWECYDSERVTERALTLRKELVEY